MNEFKGLHKALREQGWELEQAASGHWKAVPPGDGQLVTFSDRSNDPCAVHNTIALLRASGFVWPWVKPKGINGSGESESEAPEAPPDVTELLRELSEARDYFYLAKDHVEETARELQEAEQAHETARAELDTAARMMRKAKIAFDAAFELPEAATGGAGK